MMKGGASMNSTHGQNTVDVLFSLPVPKNLIGFIKELTVRAGGKVVQMESGDESDVILPPLPEKERVGRLLRAARLRAEMTQKQLAEAVGVPQSHVSEYEKNIRPIPKDKVKKLSKLLKTVPEHFIRR